MLLQRLNFVLAKDFFYDHTDPSLFLSPETRFSLVCLMSKLLHLLFCFIDIPFLLSFKAKKKFISIKSTHNY